MFSMPNCEMRNDRREAKDEGRFSEPVRLGRVLPEVMRSIKKRVEANNKVNDTKFEKLRSWEFNRQINVSTLIQLVLLAALIIGSWVNLQRQLDLLQHDVSMLLQSQRDFEQKLESLLAKSISYEYRIRAIEKTLTKSDAKQESF